ncbi:MAG: LPS-assembly protein LptD [Methylophilaceae bacterium]|nr:LPS-assembly protein LptD [Methylophilaceae bacterium]
MLKSRLLAGVTAALLMCSLRAQADSETVQADDVSGDALVIDGDKLELHLDRKMRALGNASITRGKQTVLGDTIDYNMQDDELHVVGNTRINVGSAKLTGPELKMHLSESVGEMRDASISMSRPIQPNTQQISASSPDDFSKKLGNLQSQQIGGAETFSNSEFSERGNQITNNENNNNSARHSQIGESRGDAKAIFFEGQDKKRLQDARFTTCAAGIDDWYIKAKNLLIDDYTESGTAKNAYIEFKGWPILYTPWMSFSYNNQRNSGLLTPTIGSTSKSGLEVSVPYYWNISPNMDATFATRELSKRGIQLQGEFRYLEENFSGLDNIEYLSNDNQTGSTRYYANLKHQQNLGSGWSAGYSLEKVSDNQYFSDLSTRIVTTSRVVLPQQFNVDYVDDTWHFNALAQKFQTLDGLSYPYERLPQLTLVGNKYYGDINANLYTQAVAFSTNTNAPIVPTGTRFTAYPSLSLPLSASYGYITPKIGIHSTSYSLNNVAIGLESQQRTLPIFSLDSGLFFDRDFKVADRDYSQTLEPRLFYVYIPNRDQSNIPIFDTSEADLNFSTLFSENQYTGNDRINNANQVSLALISRFIESSTGEQRLSASIGQRYYFTDQTVGLPNTEFRKSNSSDIIAGVTANLKTSWRIDAFWQYNTDDARSERATLSSRYNPEPGKALNLSYSYRRDVSGAVVGTGIDQFDISGQWPLGKGWYGVGRINYSLQDKQFIETLAGLEYDAGCWKTRTVVQRVSTATANANYALFFQLELGGLASIGANPLSVIKRSIPGYATSGLIPDTNQQPYYE